MNEKKFFVGMEPYAHKSKPVNIAKVKKDTVNAYGCYTLKEIAQFVGEDGSAFLPSYLEGGMSKRNFRRIQMFLLDFDGAKYNEKKKTYDGKNVTFEEIRQRAEGYGLKIAFAYKTFGCPKGDPFYKFRIAFVHEYPIEDANIALLIYECLQWLFPECDHACTELARLFLGGKECIYFDEDARISLVQIISSLYPVLDKQGHLNRDLRTVVKKTDIAIINNKIAVGVLDMLSVFGVNADSPYIKRVEGSGFTPIFYITKEVNCSNEGNLHQSHTSPKAGKHRLNLNHLQGICPLLDDFLNGVELGHMERFWIATNLMQISSGLELFTKIIDENYDAKAVRKWEYDRKYLKGYLPQNCTDSCPYYEECMKVSNDKNIVARLLNDRRVYIEEEPKYGSMKEATDLLAKNLEEAASSFRKGIHLIRAQTGAGKTYQIIQYAKAYPDKKILIAEPINRMKREVYKKLQSKGLSVDVTESVRELDFDSYRDLINEYMELHKLGRHGDAKKLVKKHLEELQEKEPYKEALIEIMERILKGISCCTESRIVVTTHAQLINTDEEQLKKFDLIIIDEDILYLQLLSNIKTVERTDLEIVAKCNNQVYAEIARSMLKAKPDVCYKASWYYDYHMEWDRDKKKPQIFCGDDEDEEMEDDALEQQTVMRGNVNDLLKAGSYIWDENTGTYQYFCVSKLPHLKYIVMTATADINVYQDYFKRELEVIEYPKIQVRYKGELEQFVYHSLGRSDLKNKQCIYDFVRNYTGEADIPIISFKSEEEKHKNSGLLNPFGIHFGNAVGVNNLEGKNIAIIGTPYKNPKAYILPCCYIYGEEAVNGEELRRKRVRYKGKSFLFMAFSNEQLRNFEMYSLESELEQCIGRARLLRHPCRVYLFSSFPCNQVELNMGDYLAEYKTEEEGQTVYRSVPRKD